MEAATIGLWLDLTGIFVFAISGAMVAVRRRLDIFGIAVLALAASLAGGMMRDIALGAVPPAALTDSRYLIAALAAASCVFAGHRLFERLGKPVMLLDALGLGLFAVAGTGKALGYGLSPLPAILLGVLTGVGGGVLRDLLVAEVPRVLREEIYALAALVGAGIVVACNRFGVDPVWTAVAGVAAVFLIRMVSVWRGWQAPRAFGSPD